MIALDRVEVQLGEVRAIGGVSLRVESGEWVILIGPNGAGKSTLLRASAGLVACAGSAVVNGRDLGRMNARERARTTALVPQSPELPADMTVAEYVMLGRTAHLGMFGRAGPRDRRLAAGAISRLGLRDLSARRLDALSGGESQRAVLARALAQDAPVLLLDEPITALDVGRQQEVLDLVSQLRAERSLTVLGAMHDLTLAGQYADRLALIDAGHLIRCGPPAEILRQDLIARHYRARVRVMIIDGAPVVLPGRNGSGAGDRRPPAGAISPDGA